MKPRRIILFGALLVVAVVVMLLPRGPKEPAYQGKKLSIWVEEARYGRSDEQKEQARKAIQSIGTNALPFLLSGFTTWKPGWTERVQQWITERHGRPLWQIPGERRFRNAVFGIYYLGPDASQALPELSRHLGDPDHSTAAAKAMSGCRELAIPYLLKAAASSNASVRTGAMTGFSFLIRETEVANQNLVPLLDNSDSNVRMSAAAMLVTKRLRSDLTVPVLTRSLTNSDLAQARYAMSWLSQLGEEARPAIPDLLRYLTGPNQAMSFVASNALFRIDPSALPR